MRHQPDSECNIRYPELSSGWATTSIRLGGKENFLFVTSSGLAQPLNLLTSSGKLLNHGHGPYHVVPHN